MKAKNKDDHQRTSYSNLPNGGRSASPLKSWVRRARSLGTLWAVPAMIASGTPEARAAELMPVGSAPATALNSKRTGAFNGSRSRPNFLRSQNNYRLPHQQHKFDVVSAFTAGRDDCPGTAIPAGRYSAAAPFTDTGDTTGANDTVRGIYESNDFYSQVFPVGGPDHVYSFTLTSTGPDPEIRVTSQSGSYDPAIYILAGESSFTCPAGPGSEVGPPPVYSNMAGNGEVIGEGLIRSLPLHVPLYLFIDSAASQSGPYTVSMKDVTISSRGPRTKFDFDRDGAANVSVFRPSDGFWYVTRAQQFNSRFPTQFSSVQFGVGTDRIVPADYDGDGATDVAVFRDGTWYWLNSSDQALKGFQFGLAGDIPQPADYDGDGRTELAVFRAGTWYTYNLATGQSEGFQFGLSGDQPVTGDYDGDGRADYAVNRGGIWYLNQSDYGLYSVQWGLPTDILVPADYDGDNRTDLGVFRDGTWHILPGSPGLQPYQFQFGSSGDIPVPAHYLVPAAFQRHAQAAVFRQGVWYVRTPGFSSGPFYTFRFGQANDRPIPAAYQR